MRWCDVIELIDTVKTTNAIGNPIEDEIPRQVFANKKSIRQSEFYQAAAVGMRPEIMFELRILDFNQNRKVRYEGRIYNIIRTYEKNSEILEIVCSGIVGTEVREDG